MSLLRDGYSLDYLSRYLDAKLVGNGEVLIYGLNEPTVADGRQLIFINSGKHLREVATGCQAAAVLTSEELFNQLDQRFFTNALLVSDVYLAYAKLSALFRAKPQCTPGVDKTACVADDVQLGEGVSIGPHCVVASGCVLGDGVVLSAGVYVGESCCLGKESFLYPNVTLYHGVKLGERVVVHSGAVLGADGFGYANHKGKWCKIYQLGGVQIGNDVEIGANTTIDRGALHDTVIGAGVKLDNLIQIAHNVEIGEGTAMAACVGVAGSTKIGRYCMIGGGVGIAGHIEIADQVVITGGSMVGSSLSKAGVYASSIPAIAQREWWKTVACLFKLNAVFREFKELKSRWTLRYWRDRLLGCFGRSVKLKRREK